MPKPKPKPLGSMGIYPISITQKYFHPLKVKACQRKLLLVEECVKFCTFTKKFKEFFILYDKDILKLSALTLKEFR
jgi:glutathione peroxidase-family protein